MHLGTFPGKNHCTTIIATFGIDSYGITDRIKAMTSIYDFCKENSYDFKIIQKEPFNIEDYLVPNKTNWSVNEPLKEGVHIILGGNNGIKDSNTWEAQRYTLGKMAKSCGTEYLYVHGNAPFGIPTLPENFKELFSVSERLSSFIAENLANLTSNYITVSFRFVNLLGDSDEDVAGIPTLSPEEQQSLIDKCLCELENLSNNKSNVNILITSDSSRFFRAIDNIGNNRYFHLQGDDTHHHVGFSNKASDRAMLKSFAEFILIGKALEAYQVKIGPMYASNFPKHAARVGNVPYTLIEH